MASASWAGKLAGSPSAYDQGEYAGDTMQSGVNVSEATDQYCVAFGQV